MLRKPARWTSAARMSLISHSPKIRLKLNPAPSEHERVSQVLDIRLQFFEAHPSPSDNRLASSIAPEDPHPYAGHAFLFASHFKPVVSENVVLPCGRLDDRKRGMQRTPGCRGHMDAFDMMVSANANFNVGTGKAGSREKHSRW